MFCKNCGKQITDDAAFCQFCGCKLNATNQPFKVEIKKHSNYNEEKAKKTVKTLLKELGIISLMVAVAFIVKLMVFDMLNSIPYPIVSEERQREFNREYYARMSSPVASIGDIAYKLGVGDYKYDDEMWPNSMTDINNFRKYARESHAENAANIAFWIALIGLPFIRYIILLAKWLKKG